MQVVHSHVLRPAVFKQDSELRARPWDARGSSDGNPADGPSNSNEVRKAGRQIRLRFEESIGQFGKMDGAYTAEELTEAIQMLRDILASSGPRVVCMRESEDCVLVFTDGAFEGGVATC